MATLNEQKRAAESQTVLANANEILVGVIMEIAGNDIANTINGSSVTRASIIGLAQPVFKRELEAAQ